MSKKFILCILFISIFIPMIFAGPFGYDEGMSFEEVEFNSNEIIDSYIDKNISFLQVEPKKKHSDFENYYVVIDEDYGLVKIMAETIVETNKYGTTLKNKFNSLVESLSTKYGEIDKIDILMPSSIWDEAGDYMMSLVAEDRFLMGMWETDLNTIVAIQVSASSTSKGIITLSYEYEKFAKALEKKSKVENSYL
ncbi:MAG: hypothetical protein ACPKOI_04600 [Pleomorphochaeta sp.]